MNKREKAKHKYSREHAEEERISLQKSDYTV